jgi:integrase
MMGRRGNGEGTITRRKDGRWEGRYTIQTTRGPKRKVVYGKTRKEVADKLAKGLADQGQGLAFDADKLMLGEYLDRWLAESVNGSVKPITYEQYQQQVRVHIAPALGRVKLKALTPAHLQSFYQAKLNAGMASSSVRFMHAVAHRALKQAHRWRLVHENVAAATDSPKPRPNEIRPLDAEQTKRLLDSASEAGDDLEALYVVAVTAGLRIGELLGLRWEDVDLERGTMHVRRILSRAKSGPRFTTPKNGKGRSITLTRRAVEALRSHRKRQNEVRLRSGSAWQDDGLVFASVKGTPLTRDTVDRRSFKPLLERARLPRSTRLHDLRHTCATLLLSRGVHPTFVQELLGHATVAMTLDRYSHVLPGMRDQTTAVMEAALS